MENKTKWIPDAGKKNWSTYPPMDKKKNSYWVPTPLLFIDPKVVCSDKKAKVC